VYGYSVLRNYRPRFSFNLLFQQHKSAQILLSFYQKKKNKIAIILKSKTRLCAASSEASPNKGEELFKG